MGESCIPHKFEDLKTSTKTIMSYTNVEFDLRKVFEAVPVTEVESPYTDKHKNLDKKKIRAAPGSVVSLH